MLHLKEYLPELNQGLALDVGTRFGEFAFSLAEIMPEGSRIIGLDSDPRTVEQAREKNGDKGIEFRVGEGAHMEFADGTFEVVALSNTLHHIEDYDAVLHEMLRVLRPGGWLVINEMFSDGQNRPQQIHFAQHTLEAKLDMLSGGFQRPTWKKEEILAILSRLPLREVRTAELLEEPEMDRKLETKNAKLVELVEKKAAGKPEYEALLEEARQIQKDCAAYGIQRCTQLLYLGKKK